MWSFWVNPFTRPSLREIGEMACATPAWSSRGHALKVIIIINVPIGNIKEKASEMSWICWATIHMLFRSGESKSGMFSSRPRLYVGTRVFQGKSGYSRLNQDTLHVPLAISSVKRIGKQPWISEKQWNNTQRTSKDSLHNCYILNWKW